MKRKNQKLKKTKVVEGKGTKRFKRELSFRMLSDPMRIEFDKRDIIKQIVGASILAIPVGFTEETWKLGETIPTINALIFVLLSLIFISIFIHNTYKRHSQSKNIYTHIIKRTISTYLVSFTVVAIILTLIQVAPWETNSLLAFKRTVIVAFPSSMSAAIADMIK
jgi:uncharacterized membrane protein